MFIKKKNYNFIFGIDDMAFALLGSSALGLGTSLLNKPSGSSTQTRQPAPMTPEQQKLMQDFSNAVWGFNPEDFDAQLFLKENPAIAGQMKVKKDPATGDYILSEKQKAIAKSRWYETGMKGGIPPDKVTPDYKKRLAEDIAYKTTADTELGKEIGDLRNTYLQQLAKTTGDKNAANTAYGQQQQKITDTYTNQLAQNLTEYLPQARESVSGLHDLAESVKGLATSAPIQLSGAGISGGTIPFTTGTQRAAQRQYGATEGQITDLLNQILGNQNTVGTGIYGANSEQAALLNKLANQSAANTEALNAQELAQRSAQAELLNQLANMHPPNEAENAYQDWVQQQMNADNAMRYGIPTTTTSGSINPGTANQIGQGLGIGADIFKLVQPFLPSQGLGPGGNVTAPNGSIVNGSIAPSWPY